MMDRRSSGLWPTASRSTHVPLLKTLERMRCDLAGSIVIAGSRSNGDKSRRFKTLIARIDLSPSSRSDGHEIFEMVHNGPFHRNRRSKRSNGYAQNLYKMTCSSTILSIRVGNQAI